MEPGSRVCLVVPTYNERENVARLVSEIQRVRRGDEVLLFVDDSSPDGTAEAVTEASRGNPWVTLLSRPKKGGIGSAYKDGFAFALKTFSPQVLVEMDADLQHPPEAVHRLVDAIDCGADVAVGSRYAEGGSVRGWSLWRRAVSRSANMYARALLGIRARDSTSGFRAFRSSAAEKVVSSELPASGFEFQVATLHLLGRDSRVVEVPYEFSARAAGSSKLRVSDMARFFVAVVKLAIS